MKLIHKLLPIAAIFLIFCGVATATTDPEPNPFEPAALAADEKVFDTKIVNVDDKKVFVRDEAGTEFGGEFEKILKYRDGGGPAAAEEFRVGDRVRTLVDANEILAIQDFDLQLCEQTFSGWAREIGDGKFELEATDGKNFTVFFGETTGFRDEDKKRIFGYSPRDAAELTVHGVRNLNTDEIFTETFGAYVVVLPADSLVAAPNSPTFSDVENETEFSPAIEFVAAEEIVSGYDDKTFRPENPINRAEFTKILTGARFADELANFEISESCFPDFAAEDWFARFVCLAKEKEILAGYPDGTFQPANEVNLAEALAIIVGAFGWTTDEPADGEEWFAPFFATAEKIEILPSDFGEAGDKLTRGKMAELVTRAVKFSRGELPDYLSEN